MVADLSIIVGPNNSGKSRALMDIVGLMQFPPAAPLVLSDLDVVLPSSLDEALGSCDGRISNGTLSYLEPSLTDAYLASPVSPERLDETIRDAGTVGRSAVLQFFGRSFLAWLGTEQRLAISRTVRSGSAASTPSSLLDLLYAKGVAGEARLNGSLRNMFDRTLRLDYSDRPTLLLRVGGEELDDVSVDPREQLTQFANVSKLEEQGDGLRSAAGICMALEIANRRITLVDEPESFLHPPQIAALGRYLRQRARDIQIILATHSVDILRSALADGSDNVTVIRLNRDGNINRPHVVSSQLLREIVNHPVLGSAHLLEGLFYSGVVVTEGDSDRAIYERIASQIDPGNDSYFMHTHDKHAVSKAIETYHALSVPCASILDFDVLNDEGVMKSLLRAHLADEELTKFVIAARAELAAWVEGTADAERRLREGEEKMRSSTEVLRAEKSLSTKLAVLSQLGNFLKYSKDPWNKVKRSGLRASGMPTEVKRNCEEALKRAQAVGIFIVPYGELESWLPNSVTANSSKAAWTVGALKVIPSLKVELSGDIWEFVSDIRTFLTA